MDTLIMTVKTFKVVVCYFAINTLTTEIAIDPNVSKFTIIFGDIGTIISKFNFRHFFATGI
jgi:hypothetical protein